MPHWSHSSFLICFPSLLSVFCPNWMRKTSLVSFLPSVSAKLISWSAFDVTRISIFYWHGIWVTLLFPCKYQRKCFSVKGHAPFLLFLPLFNCGSISCEFTVTLLWIFSFPSLPVLLRRWSLGTRKRSPVHSDTPPVKYFGFIFCLSSPAGPVSRKPRKLFGPVKP